MFVRDLVRKLERLKNKAYRDGYMQTQVRSRIAHQFRALRKKAGLSQSQMAERTGKKQSTISRLENEEYGRVSVQTLLDVASALDVALLVQFVSYPEFLRRGTDYSEGALSAATIHESLAHCEGTTTQTETQFAFYAVGSSEPTIADIVRGNREDTIRWPTAPQTFDIIPPVHSGTPLMITRRP